MNTILTVVIAAALGLGLLTAIIWDIATEAIKSAGKKETDLEGGE